MGTVQFDVDAKVARVTLSNPARHNAMSQAMWERLAEVIAEVSANQEIRVVVLRGDGEKAFVSGADISEFETQRSSAEGVKAYDRAVTRAQSALVECTVPVIACIRGICMGGGMGLAVSCDLRFGETSARFRMPAARLGLGYGLSSMHRLVDTIGAAHAAEIFYTARTFDGVEAQRIGLLHRAHAPEALGPAVEKVAAAIAENAPLTIKAAKLAIRSASAGPRQRDLEQVQRAILACFESDDYIEGRRAFVEKRAPRFTGR